MQDQNDQWVSQVTANYQWERIKVEVLIWWHLSPSLVTYLSKFLKNQIQSYSALHPHVHKSSLLDWSYNFYKAKSQRNKHSEKKWKWLKTKISDFCISLTLFLYPQMNRHLTGPHSVKDSRVTAILLSQLPSFGSKEGWACEVMIPKSAEWSDWRITDTPPSQCAGLSCRDGSELKVFHYIFKGARLGSQHTQWLTTTTNPNSMVSHDQFWSLKALNIHCAYFIYPWKSLIYIK